MALAPGIPMVGPTADPVPFGLSTNLGRPDRKNLLGGVIDAGLQNLDEARSNALWKPREN